jgi:5-(carboxyamino)imidazole ribonucleotide synthase
MAEDYAARVVDALGYVGVLAIELFEVDGGLMANEMAPRVHNSGHWTIEGAETSQFENHLRAVAGLPLGSTAPRGHSAMVNNLGMLPDAAAVLAVEGAHLHLYGKAPRAGRKLGHITVRGDDAARVMERARVVMGLVGEEWSYSSNR